MWLLVIVGSTRFDIPFENICCLYAKKIDAANTPVLSFLFVCFFQRKTILFVMINTSAFLVSLKQTKMSRNDKNIHSDICTKRRDRSACAFAQSNQNLHWPHFGIAKYAKYISELRNYVTIRSTSSPTPTPPPLPSQEEKTDKYK